MESNLKYSPKHPFDNSDANYISGLSTILVAAIEETKDRISQIEYIFCSQLYPKFQLNPQSLQKIYSEAQEVAEAAYKQKEKDLLLQIEKLQCQNQQALEENQSLKLEKNNIADMEIQSRNYVAEVQKELKQKTVEANEGRDECQNLQKLLEYKSSLLHSYEKSIGELEERNTMLLKMQKKLEVGTEELKQELMKKATEVDEVMELQNKLLQINQTKSSLIVQKDTQLKEYEGKTNIVVSKLANMENKANELLSVVDKGKELQGNLLKKIESQALEIMNHEQQFIKYEKENRLLAAEVEKKSVETEEVKKQQQQLLQRSDAFHVERVKRGRALEEFAEERKQLLDKQKVLESTVSKLEQILSERMKESSEGMELHGKLLQQIEVKDSELLAVKRKRMEAINAFKRVKSQYTYLLKKFNLTPETIIDEMEDKSELIRRNQTPVTSRATVMENNKASGISGDVTKLLGIQQASEDKKRALSVQRPSPISPSTSNINIDPKCPTSIKSCLPAGAKRPISYWRDTRSHQSRVGPDPHDDFLDTPLENVRGNLGKAMKGDNPNIPKPALIDMHLDDSEDHTQDMNPADVDGPQHLQTSPSNAGTSGFKYVGPVRKKSERENLKGVECKQCKKFYDAVLPGSGEQQNIRCEHHDGVSRHRYRYAPPLTPEGFWNIGFESEM